MKEEEKRELHKAEKKRAVLEGGKKELEQNKWSGLPRDRVSKQSGHGRGGMSRGSKIGGGEGTVGGYSPVQGGT